MGIIEQAARRLEQLKGAGIDVSPADQPVSLPASTSTAASGSLLSQAAPRVETFLNGSAPVASKAARLDLNAMARNSLLVPNHGLPALEQEFRIVKQPLLANAIGPARVARGNLIFVTSAVPGEGKTFCAVNLALSMAAEIDKTVLLIDADVARPSVASRLGIDPGPGLLDLLSQPELGLPEIMLRTNVSKLTVLPAGTPRPNSAELLASTEMKRLLDEIAERYADRVIVMDGPPLLATIEARILAQLAGQVVMVVEAGKTSQAIVSQAFALVEKCPIVMSVLNRRPAALGRYRYGYGY